MNQSVDWTQFGMLGFTALLSVLTGVYVWLTHRLLRSQTDPCVIAYVRHDESRPSTLLIVVENIGKGLARDIRFESSLAIPNRAFGIDVQSAQTAETMKSGPLVHGIPALGPGDSRRLVWGQCGGLSKAIGDAVIYVTCCFKSQDKRSHRTECAFDIKSFVGTDLVDSDGARQCAKELKRLADGAFKMLQPQMDSQM